MKTNNIEYYNKRANEFISGTKDADLSDLRRKFTEKLPAGVRILDLGCGSGRDSLAFKEMGFDVHAIDGSSELVKYCKTFLGDNVSCATFEDFDSYLKFDGIWACASLIHVERDSLDAVILKYTKMLNENGVFYMSFKSRDEDYSRDGRSFTCFTKESLEKYLNCHVRTECVVVRGR